MPNCPNAANGGCVPATFTKETTLQAYTDAQQPIVVRNDMTGVTVAVMQKAEAKAAAAK